MMAKMELPMFGPGLKQKVARAHAWRLQEAFKTSLGMAGLHSAKVGAGDKEKGYIIRQNTF